MTKYARATRASVVLTCSGGSLSFEVGDDGVGFDPTTVSRGIGLQSMADRIEALDGSLTVASEPGAGSVISGSIPVPSEIAGER